MIYRYKKIRLIINLKIQLKILFLPKVLSKIVIKIN